MVDEEIFRLWDDLADFEASQSEQAAAHIMLALCVLSGATNATWAGATRLEARSADDPLQGWRVTAMQALHPVDSGSNETSIGEILRVWDRREIDPSFLLPIHGVGSFRTYSLRRDLPAEWFASAFYESRYASVGVHDAAFVAFPLNRDCESHFGFYGPRTFTDAAITRIATALRGIKWFHRQLMLSNGLSMGSAPLTPTERRVLHLLLTEASEKQIAHQFAIAPSTAHQHVVSIFRKLGVRSRAGLMSLWLNRRR